MPVRATHAHPLEDLAPGYVGSRWHGHSAVNDPRSNEPPGRLQAPARGSPGRRWGVSAREDQRDAERRQRQAGAEQPRQLPHPADPTWRLWDVALATTANACAFPGAEPTGIRRCPKTGASHSYRRFSRVKLARDEHAVYQPAAGKGLGPGRHGRFIYAPMADDHEAKLLALSLAYVNCRRDFIRAMLIAHAMACPISRWPGLRACLRSPCGA
jgi:hypothetical protein